MTGLALILALAAGPGAGSVTITPQTAPIAAPITVKVTVPVNDGETVKFPENPPLPDGAELLSIRRGAGTMEFTFLAYKVGAAVLPGMEYTALLPDGKEEKRSTEPAAFTIVSVRTDPKTADQPVEIRPPVAIPFDWGIYLPYALALLAAGILGALFWRWRSRRKGQVASAPPPPPIPAHVIAFESLARLREEDLFAKGEGRRHFFLVSEILRRYVEGRYGVPALERTTDEFDAVFDLRFERKGKREPLLEILRECDRVKFAKHEAAREEGMRMVDRAWGWVESTRLAELARGPEGK